MPPIQSNNNTVLTEDDIQYIMANTDFERVRLIDWFSEFKRRCPSCILDKPAFIKFYKKVLRINHAVENHYFDAVFKVFDTNSDGYIDYNEFIFSFWIKAKANLREKLGWIFDIYDIDRDGHIVHSELTKMIDLVLNLKGIKENASTKALSIMELADRSRDGRISKQEFIAACTKNEELLLLFSPFFEVKLSNFLDLTELSLQFLSANTNYEREKIIQWHIDFLKECPDGALDKPAFIKFYKKLSKVDHPDEKQFFDALFNLFDTDGNDFIEFSEFLILFWIKKKANLRDKLSWIFDIYDLDKDGYLTQLELTKLFKLVLNVRGIKQNSTSRALKMMEEIDRSKDGKIPKDEFIVGSTNDEQLLSLFSQL